METADKDSQNLQKLGTNVANLIECIMLGKGCLSMLQEQQSHHLLLDQLDHHAIAVEVGTTAQSARTQNATTVARKVT